MAKRYTIERFGDSDSVVEIIAENLQHLITKAANKFGLDAATLIVRTSTGRVQDEDVFQSHEIGTKFFILAPGEKWTQGILFYSILFLFLFLLYYFLIATATS